MFQRQPNGFGCFVFQFCLLAIAFSAIDGSVVFHRAERLTQDFCGEGEFRVHWPIQHQTMACVKAELGPKTLAGAQHFCHTPAKLMTQPQNTTPVVASRPIIPLGSKLKLLDTIYTMAGVRFDGERYYFLTDENKGVCFFPSDVVEKMQRV